MKSKDNKFNILEKALEEYLYLLEAQLQAFPIVKKSMESLINANLNKIIKYVKQNNIPTDREKGAQLTEEHVKPFMSLTHNFTHSISAEKLYNRNIIVTFISIYDYFLSDIIRAIYKIQPDFINSCGNKEISVARLLKASSINELKNDIITDEVDNILRGNHDSQIKWFETKLKLPLKENISKYDDFIEITERRNLFVHSNGKISSQYIKNCDGKYLISEKGNLKIGDMLEADENYIRKAYHLLVEIGVIITQLLWRNIGGKEELENADKSLVQIIFNLLKEKQYYLAKTLSSFATNPKHKSCNNEYTIIKRINKALAFYLNGEKEESDKIIESYDWSGLDKKYQLAILVLKENKEEVIELMKSIGKNDDYKEMYREWPIFRPLRNDKEFIETFESIYNEPLEIYEVTPITWNEYKDYIKDPQKFFKEYMIETP